MVTSRAVVGSSAISRRGLQLMAIANATRWRMPPESTLGNWRNVRRGLGMPTAFSSSSARATSGRAPERCWW